MNLPGFALKHRPITWTAVALVAIWGMQNFLTMSRREDPAITIRNCVVLTRWAGAPAERMEELVTDPLEEKISEINEIKTLTSKSRVGLSVIEIELEETIDDVDQFWDEVRSKVAQVRMPEGCSKPFVNGDFGDVHDVNLALYQTPPQGGWTEANERYRYSPRRMELLAETIKDELLLLPQVGKVDLWGVRDERIWVEMDSADWARIDLTASELSRLMEARNIVAPGGELNTESGSFTVTPTGEFQNVEQMNRMLVGRLDGRLPVLLGDLPLRIRRGYEEPPRHKVRCATPGTGGTDGVVLGIAMKVGSNVVEMGQGVGRTIEHIKATVLPPDIEVAWSNDLPRQVWTKISDFNSNLLQAIAIVMLMAFLIIGWRPAIVMATAVPLSMLAAFAVVPMFGVELEQFSIASLIIAMGMVVDNATVVSENSIRYLQSGMSRIEAVTRGARDLAIPIIAATATTVAAFLPMLAIIGNVGEYIGSLPIVVAATLIASYFVAMFVTPLMCHALLKKDEKQAKEVEKKAGKYERMMGWCLNHKLLVILVCLGLFGGSQVLGTMIGSQFFPAGDRDQFFIKVWMPEGTSLAANEKICHEIEEILLDTSRDAEGNERLANMVAYIGAGGPRLMLTQSPEQNYPYFSHIVINTKDAKTSKAYAAEVRKRTDRIAGANIQVETFQLGPPIKHPIAFRMSGTDSDVLRKAAADMMRIVRETPGAEMPSSDWGFSAYQVEVRVDNDAANLAGVTNADVAMTMNTLLAGAPLTTYREGDHQVPVMLRTIPERRGSLTELDRIYVNGRTGKVPLSALAEVIPTWRPSVIARRNRARTVEIGCRAAPDALPNAVAAAMKPRMEELLASLPPGYRLEEGGEKEKTTESQAKIAGAMAIAVLLIILVLTIQYNSILKPFIILFTVPMALIGVMIGLYVTGWAMGFMPMLGVLSLVGIVINNAILLIDFLEEKVREGLPLREAAAVAGRVRMKPIFLTSLTTVGGLLPLALFGGPLWAGMAWGMIFGLAFSTLLTLVVVPTLYVLFAEKLKMKVV